MHNIPYQKKTDMQTESPLSKKVEGNSNKTNGIINRTAKYIFGYLLFKQ